MRFAVLFTDAVDAPADLRQRHMADHLAFLEAHADHITAAGPLFEGDKGAGGLWLVTAPDAKAVYDLVQADPFWPTGLRETVRILEWRQVFSDGVRR